MRPGHGGTEALVLQPIQEEDTLVGGSGESQAGRVGIFDLKCGVCTWGCTGRSRRLRAVPLCVIAHHVHHHTHTHTPLDADTLTMCTQTQAACTHNHGAPPNPSSHSSLLEPEAPPLLVVVLLGDASVKHPPAPLVNEVAEGDKGDLVERHLHQEVDVLLCQGKGALPSGPGLPPAMSGQLGWAGRAVGGGSRTGLHRFGSRDLHLGRVCGRRPPTRPTGGPAPHRSVPARPVGPEVSSLRLPRSLPPPPVSP